MARRKGRPYPKDAERKKRVSIALAQHGMNITDLANAIGVKLPNVSEVISGRRLSPLTEARIAAFLGKPVGELFPSRTIAELTNMRAAEGEQRSAA